jgi:hypothetical protein
MYDNLEKLKEIVKSVTGDYIIEIGNNNVASTELSCYIPQVILEKHLLGVEKYENSISPKGILITSFRVSIDPQI